MRKTLSLAAAALCTLALGTAGAADSNVEFSATMVQSMPNQQESTTRIYVGGNTMRSESEFQGQPRVSIVDTANQVAWMLNPAKKEYVEMRGKGSAAPGAAAANRPPLPDEPGSPCQQAGSDIQCERLGTETVNGRKAQKWEFTTSQGGKTMTSTVWVDKELRMPIRQELPGGMVSELRDIQVEPQPEHLFQVPADYTRIEMPKRGQGQRQGQGRYPSP